MYTYNGNYPLYAVFLPDPKNSGHRIPFKCRIESDSGQFYTLSTAGLRDIGQELTIVTPKNFKKTEGARVIMDGIVYSVQSVRASIPDKTIGGTLNRKINAEYYIELI